MGLNDSFEDPRAAEVENLDGATRNAIRTATVPELELFRAHAARIVQFAAQDRPRALAHAFIVKRMCERINAEARTPKSRVARRGVLDHEVPEGEEQAYACADAAAASVKDQFNGA